MVSVEFRLKRITGCKQQTAYKIKRKADHRSVRSVQVFNPQTGPSLQRIGAGFVHRLTGAYIGTDFLFAQRGKGDIGAVCICPGSAIRRYDRYTGIDLMCFPGEQLKHPDCIVLVLWFAEGLFLPGNERISRQNKTAGMCKGGCGCLAAGKQPDCIACGKAAAFIDVGIIGFESQSKPAEQIAPAG